MITTTVNKDELLFHGISLHPDESRWFVAYVPFRREKSALRTILSKGIECYVPLVKRTKRYVRKIKNYEIPLINNYVFVKITKKEYVDVLKVRDVCGFVKFDGRMISVPQKEIDILKRVVGDQNIVIDIFCDQDLIGKKVEIIQGQLTGLKGEVVEVVGKKKLMVHLQTLGITLRMQVPQKYLNPLMV